MTSRRLLIASTVFALFVVFDLALFGWLILDSLSQREVEEVLLEARQDAQPLAAELEALAKTFGTDLWVAVSVSMEKLTYVESVLSEREVVHKIEIRDRDGTVVYDEVLRRENLPVDRSETPRVEAGRVGVDGLDPPAVEPSLEEVAVEIGDFGTVVIGLNREQLQRRIELLRRELIQRVSLIGGVTFSLLVAALATIGVLLRRARRLEEQALEGERLAYVGTLASGLAHEIRNPLNSLNLNMQMLEEEACVASSDGSARRLVSITRSEISRLERLVTDFLSYARPGAIELEEVPARRLLDRVIEVLAGEIHDRSAEVRIEDASDGVGVRVDAAQIGQILLNLTQNALAATEGSGRLPVVRLRAAREGDRVVLEVVDNGVGIPEADRDRVFELFYSTRKGGTGLGLAIVERIAKAHGIEIEVDSLPGEGTSVRLRLPAAASLPGRQATLGPTLARREPAASR